MLLDSLLGTPCRACGDRSRLQRLGDFPPTHTGPFHTHQFGLLHCPRCEVVYLEPAPTATDLRTLYQESDQFDGDHYTSDERVAAILGYCNDAIDRLGLLPPPSGRMLEIGAGFAWLSRACKGRDASITTIGQDVSAEVAERCPWVDRYHVGDFSTLDDTGPFQLASMTHVVEHLVDPAAMLGAISARLSKGGKLFITAPFRPTGWRPSHGIQGWREYSYLHVPAHITYFSRRWFERTAPMHAMKVAHWNADHEDGQAFELVLVRA